MTCCSSKIVFNLFKDTESLKHKTGRGCSYYLEILYKCLMLHLTWIEAGRGARSYRASGHFCQQNGYFETHEMSPSFLSVVVNLNSSVLVRYESLVPTGDTELGSDEVL